MFNYKVTSCVFFLMILSINLFATGVSFEENREDAINDLKTFTVESSSLILEEGSSDSIPTMKEYWLNFEDNSINEVFNFTVNINDIGIGSNSIYYKWAKNNNGNMVLQSGTASNYDIKIKYSNYINTSQNITTNNTTISDKFFYNSSAGTILNSATGTTISGIFANNHNSQIDQFYNGGNIINYRYKINSIDGIFVNNYENGSTRALGGAIFNTENSVGVIRSYIGDITGDFIGNYTSSSGSGSNVRSSGGAIFNYTTIENINSNFLLNHSNGISGIVEGGAIANIDIDTNNMAYITNIKGDFLLNYIYAKGDNVKAIGGAIANNGYITNIEGNFIGNYIKIENNNNTGNGGAIYNVHDIKNITGNFIENYVDSYSNAYGGAIYSKNSLAGEYCINSITGDFIGNYVKSTKGSAYGGAIYNAHIINNITGKFINNSAQISLSGGACGGAIYNSAEGEIKIGDKSIFSNNTVYSKYQSLNLKGGAIYNDGYLEIGKEVNFLQNMIISEDYYSSGSAGYTSGGAICNSKNGEIKIGEHSIFRENQIIIDGIGGFGTAICNSGTIEIGADSLFEDNSGGGAIYNFGTITFIDGVKFINNIGGGAIHNYGTINLIANTKNIEFTGNQSSTGKSCAIINDDGDINLWASNNADIVFNDVIYMQKASVLNINISTNTLMANGKIVLNEDMSKYDGVVNFYGGELELQSRMEENSNININKFFSGNINLSSGTLNILNNSIDNITISTLTTTANVNLQIDVDLSNNNFIVLFNSEISPNINILTSGYYNGYEYVFENDLKSGVLYYEKTGIERTFKEIINLEKYTRSYSLSDDESVTEDLENLGGHQLTIFGNGHDVISLDNLEGIYVSEDKVLNIENVNNWSGFNSAYGAIKNEGTLNISGTNFSSNVGQDIINDGNLTLSGVSSSFEKGIVGLGTTTISGVNVNLVNAVIEQNKIEINNNGSLIANASNIIADIENNSNLTFTQGTNNNYIFGSGTTIIDGEVINSSTIVNSIMINSNKQLITGVDAVTGNIENNGNLVLDNNGINNNFIYGTGTTTIDGSIINSSTIVNSIMMHK